MNRLYFDIETIPDQRPGAKDRVARGISPPGNMSKPETIAAWEAEKRPAEIERAWRKTSLSGGAGHIATIAWAFDDDEPMSAFADNWGSPDGEKAVINQFFASVGEWLAARRDGGDTTRPTIVGHNIVNFDLRFLFQRCVVLGARVPFWLPINPKPWDTDIVVDTMAVWGGPRDYVRMDDICEALGIPTKGSEFNGEEDIDGGKVWDYVRDGKIHLVAEYCRGDVIRTRNIERRIAGCMELRRG